MFPYFTEYLYNGNSVMFKGVTELLFVELGIKIFGS